MSKWALELSISSAKTFPNKSSQFVLHVIITITVIIIIVIVTIINLIIAIMMIYRVLTMCQELLWKLVEVWKIYVAKKYILNYKEDHLAAN